MTAKEVFELLQIQGIGGLALSVTLIILSAIQIAPVKWHPWTKILGWLGKQINQDLSAKIDGIESKLDSHIEKYTVQRADDIRNTILVSQMNAVVESCIQKSNFVLLFPNVTRMNNMLKTTI